MTIKKSSSKKPHVHIESKSGQPGYDGYIPAPYPIFVPTVYGKDPNNPNNCKIELEILILNNGRKVIALDSLTYAIYHMKIFYEELTKNEDIEHTQHAKIMLGGLLNFLTDIEKQPK
jgi:hypothetical protein